MNEFEPVDHKDSDPEYRARVREGVESTLDARLVDASADELLGEWDGTYPYQPDSPARRYTYFADGTFLHPYAEADSPRARWRLKDGVYGEATWGKPIPEYGIDEGTWNTETYHCARTEAGAIVIWNGDASLLRLLTRPQ